MLSLGSVVTIISVVEVTRSSSVLLCFPEHLPGCSTVLWKESEAGEGCGSGAGLCIQIS